MNKFNPGDTVRVTYNLNQFGEEIQKITNVKYYRETEIIDSDGEIWSLNYHLVLVEIYSPRENDLCIFYNDNSQSLKISKFKQVAEQGMYQDQQFNYYEHCRAYTRDNLDFLVNIIKD